MKLSLFCSANVLAWVSLAAGAQAQTVIIAANSSNTGQNGSGVLLAPASAENTNATTGDPEWAFVGYDNSYGFANITYAPVSTSSNSVPSSASSTGTGTVLTGPAYVVENPPEPAWAPPVANTEYISATPNAGIGGMPGTFEYAFTFNSPISGIVNFSGVASADNGLRIVYNGTTEATFGGQLILSTAPGWVAGLSTAGGSNAASPAGGSVYGAGAAPFNFYAPVVVGNNTLDFYVSNFDDTGGNYGGDEEGLYVTNFSIVPEPRDYALYFLGAAMGLMVLKRVRRVAGR